MLDEYVEFREYTCLMDENSPRRLKTSNMAKGQFSGVPRALKIISRFAYYEKNMRPDAIKYLLNLWCGFEEDSEKYGISAMEEFKSVTGWLPDYLKIVLEGKPGQADALIDDLKGQKRQNWNRGAYQESGNVNDTNSIYFESIIAEAVNQGPLKRYELVFDKDPKDGCAKKNEAFLYDRGLKLVAAVLLNKIEDSCYAPVNFVDCSNWIRKGCDDAKKISKRVIGDFTYERNGEQAPVIHVEYLQDDGRSKHGPMLTLEQEWYEEYGPRIILQENTDDINSEYIFKDMGCGEPLKKI